ELQFRRKKAGGERGPKDNYGPDREIVSAHATAKQNGELVLNMETENLVADGNELTYDCPTETRGPKMVRRGTPMTAAKDANKIEAQELTLIGADAGGKGQLAVAKGPGRIDLYDRGNEKMPYPQHALWKDQLVSTKDGPYDLLTLTGDAAFL